MVGRSWFAYLRTQIAKVSTGRRLSVDGNCGRDWITFPMCVIPADEIHVFKGGRVVDQLQHTNETSLSINRGTNRVRSVKSKKNPTLPTMRYNIEIWTIGPPFEISFYQKGQTSEKDEGGKGDRGREKELVKDESLWNRDRSAPGRAASNLKYSHGPAFDGWSSKRTNRPLGRLQYAFSLRIFSL